MARKQARPLPSGDEIARRSRELGGDLKLCCLAHRVQQVFALAGFDQVFQLWATRDEALAAFTAPPHGPERVCDGGS